MKLNSLSTKFNVVVGLIVLFATILVIAAITTLSIRSMHRTAVQELHTDMAAAHRLLGAIDTVMTERIKGAMALLKAQGGQLGEATLADPVQLGERNVPQLMLGGQSQVQNYQLVDSVTAIVGGTATLFVKDGDTFVRVSTNVIRDGKRAVGTILDPAGKAIQSIRQGEDFVGQVDILGSPYLTSYSPIRDRDGRTIGIWYVGYKADLAALQQAIGESRILQHGFVALVDDRGRVRTHSATADKETVQALVKGDLAGWNVERVAFAPWGFSLVGAYPDAEVNELIQSRALAIGAAGVVAFLLLAAMISWLFKRLVVTPLGEATRLASRVAAGELDNPVPQGRRDETGALLQSLATMQSELCDRLARDARDAAERNRVRAALDKVPVSVTVSDGDDQLIYMNDAAADLLDLIRGGSGQRDQGNAGQLLGRPMAQLFDDQAYRQAWSGRQGAAQRHRVVIGGRHLDLVVVPVIGADGTCQGKATQWLDVTDQLAEAAQERRRLDEERQVAAVNLRLKVALDNVSSNVMVADENHRIIYMNDTALRLFRDAQQDIRNDLPTFDADRIVGSDFDVFHKNPAHQRRLLDGLSDTYRAGFDVGGRTMRIVANPVIDAEGRKLGTVVEWTDRTAEVAVEREIDALVEAARAGDLGRRISLDGKQGFFRQLGEGFNALLEELDGVFSNIAEVMGYLADGDLRKDIARDYSGTFGQVKDDVNQMVARLRDTIGQLRDVSHEVESSAQEIGQGNNNLSVRTEQQAASLEETATSMEELTSTVRNNAANAQQANQVATGARQAAERGSRVVTDAIRAMDQISNASARIAEILGVIDEIAFQTNLLALNASVEAARAGEQGRGFAVVATEVRSLAGRSATAAKEIKALIQDSVDKVRSGGELVNESGKMLEEISASVKKVGDIVAEIAAASAEQAAGIDQVNQTITTIDEMTQQNAALAEQTSAASVAMVSNARQMRELTGLFKT